MRTSPAIAAIFLVLSSGPALSSDFKCSVKSVSVLGKDGLLEKGGVKVEEFTVSRSTGIISGGGLNNARSGQLPTVYNTLPSENGFKAITIYSPNPTVDYLDIGEWKDGPKKPFIYQSAWSSIYTGLCTYY